MAVYNIITHSDRPQGTYSLTRLEKITMPLLNWQQLMWQIPLDSKPLVVEMVQGLHGPNRTEYHCLPSHWFLHLCRYTASIAINGIEAPIRPGFVSVLPPGTTTVCRYTERALHLCAHFTFPAEAADSGVMIAAIQDLGQDFGRMEQALEEGIASFGVNQRRAEVRLWDILWQLCSEPVPPRLPLKAYPSAYEKAKDIIKERLAKPLSVAALAAEIGVSHNQLTRFFRFHDRMTVVSYIRDQRMQQANYLLRHTTLPVKVIGEQVGFEDPSFFSKTFHAAFGVTPSSLRNTKETPRA